MATPSTSGKAHGERSVLGGRSGVLYLRCTSDHLEEGRTAPVSEKEAGVLVSEAAYRVQRLMEALSSGG